MKEDPTYPSLLEFQTSADRDSTGERKRKKKKKVLEKRRFTDLREEDLKVGEKFSELADVWEGLSRFMPCIHQSDTQSLVNMEIFPPKCSRQLLPALHARRYV